MTLTGRNATVGRDTYAVRNCHPPMTPRKISWRRTGRSRLAS